MSAERKPVETEQGRNADPNRRLMRAMGGSGYTAIPPDQHEWQRAPGEPPIHRIWSWMIHHTCFYYHTEDKDGQKKNYATDERGAALNIQNMADDLGMDLHFCRAEWRKGIKRSLWRDSDPDKKEGKGRLVLLAKVKPAADGEGEKEEAGVCTHPFPPYIFNKIKDWPVERLRECEAGYLAVQRLEKDLHAELTATLRGTCRSQAYDTWAKAWGLELMRNPGNKSPDDSEPELGALEDAEELAVAAVAALQVELAEATEEVRASEALLGRLRHVVRKAAGLLDALAGDGKAERQLAALIEGFVQTRLISVQIAPREPYTPSYTPDSPPLSLLPVAKANKNKRAGVKVDGSLNTEGPTRSTKKHAPGTYTGADSVERTPEILAAAAALLIGINRLQRQHPDKFAGELVSTQSRADQALGAKIVATIGPDAVDLFILYVEQRAKERAMGHQLTPALIFELTGDFTRRRGQIEQELRDAAAAEVEAESRREARVAEQQAEDERNLQLDEWVRDAWERLYLDDKAGRLSAAELIMRRDPLWDRKWRSDRDARQVEREARAKRELRRELDERDRASKGVR